MIVQDITDVWTSITKRPPYNILHTGHVVGAELEDPGPVRGPERGEGDGHDILDGDVALLHTLRVVLLAEPIVLVLFDDVEDGSLVAEVVRAGLDPGVALNTAEQPHAHQALLTTNIRTDELGIPPAVVGSEQSGGEQPPELGQGLLTLILFLDAAADGSSDDVEHSLLGRVSRGQLS